MSDKRNIFISHVHQDDDLLPKPKDLVDRAGMEMRNGSINRPQEGQRECMRFPGIRSAVFAVLVLALVMSK